VKPRYRYSYTSGTWHSTLGIPGPLDRRWFRQPGPVLYPAGFWSELMGRMRRENV